MRKGCVAAEGEGVTLNRVRGYVMFIIVAVMGAVFLFNGVSDKIGISKAVDFNDIDYDEVKKNMYVKSSTNMVLDYYCEEITTRNGVETGKNRWYLVPYSNDGENWHFIGVKVNKSRINDYEKVCNDTEKWLNSDTLTLSYELKIQGKVKKCSGKVKKYLNEYIDEWEEYNGECDDMFVPYYIDMTTTSGSNALMIIGGILFAFGGGAILILFLTGRKKAHDASEYDGYTTYTSSETGTASAGYTNQEGFFNNGGDELDQILAEDERKREEAENKKNDPFYQ